MNDPLRYDTTGHDDERGRLRVFAIQYRLSLAHTRSYESYRGAMRELMDTFVVPHLIPGRPALVVFPELIGLPTLAIGERGEAFRALAAELQVPSGEGVPPGLTAGMSALGQAYAPQIGAYHERFGSLDPRTGLFLAATDTAARAFSCTFADIARDYGVYVVAGNAQPEFTETSDPGLVAAFADPALGAASAFLASSARVCNVTFLWGPQDLSASGPRCERNLMFRNEKVPLTEIEQVLGLDPGPATGPAARRNAGPVEVEGFQVGFATSLPAFQYGYDFGRGPAPDPFADLGQTYAAAQDALGVEVMIQADANPGPWAAPVASGAWQPLEWMSSTWRAVADPSANFRYNVTPMMTGNLLDVVFDGQSAITARGARGEGRHYVGNLETGPGDGAAYEIYRGVKREFLALAPWVTPDAPRAELMNTMMALLPGTGSPIENQYVETALYADLLPAHGPAGEEGQR